MKPVNKRFNRMVKSCIFTLFGCMSVAANAQVKTSEYQQTAGVSGTLRSVGSDTLANLMTLWGQEFKEIYPQVKIQIQASGSSTAPPALVEGLAELGPMSREMKASEISYFNHRYGYSPLVLKVAIDAIALFVDRRNPIHGLTLDQVDGIFSVTRFCGSASAIDTWQQLGYQVPGADRFIKLFGRNSVSGTYGMFKREALCDGDFRATVNEQPGSASVVQSVAYSKGAIGYAAFGYKTAGVRAVPISEDGSEFVPVTVETIASGEYPFSRFLYLVVNKAPEQPLPTLQREFLLFILSTEGQELVRRDGYIGLPADTLQRQRRLILE